MIVCFFILPLVTICCLNLIVYLNIYKRSKGFVQSKPTVSQTITQPISDASSAQGQHQSESTGVSTISISVQNKNEKKNPIKTAKPVENNKRVEFNRHRKAAITLAVLVGVFISCWLPFYIAATLEALCKGCFPVQIWEITNYLLWANSMVNPFLYAAMNVYFRENFIKFLCLERFVKKGADPPKTATSSG